MGSQPTVGSSDLMADRFPERRDDGSFVVVAIFEIDRPQAEEALAQQLQLTVAKRGGSEGERLLSEFATLPELERLEGETLGVVFEGRADAQVWKDWLVLVTRELEEVEGTHFVAFEDRVARRRHLTWPPAGE